jgi:hypothetical protein
MLLKISNSIGSVFARPTRRVYFPRTPPPQNTLLQVKFLKFLLTFLVRTPKILGQWLSLYKV